jgi:hypothetical protein
MAFCNLDSQAGKTKSYLHLSSGKPGNKNLKI